MRFLFFLIVLLGQLNHSQNLFGQTINIPKDTSFSVNSTFEKEKKKFPNIQIVQVNSKHVKVSKDLTYKNVGNRDLKIDDFEPKLHHKKVGIVLLHGGGWRSGDKTHMHQLSLALAQKGYTCLAVACRLSLEAKYPAAVGYVQVAISWLKKNSKIYTIDRSNILCLVTSSGGQLAGLVGAFTRSIHKERIY